MVKTRILPGAEEFRFDAGPIGVLLVHGFTGCPASMRPMGEWLAERGISSVGPRLAGHGTSWNDLETTTWQDWEREAEDGLSDLAGRCGDVIVVGLSMGGALALHLAAKHAERLFCQRQHVRPRLFALAFRIVQSERRRRQIRVDRARAQ